MDKHVVVSLYEGILLKERKEQTTDTWSTDAFTEITLSKRSRIETGTDCLISCT